MITESLRVGATLEGFRLSVSPVHREHANLSPEQVLHGRSAIWTVIEFDIRDNEADRLADALSHSLDRFGWLAHLQSDAQAFVEFSNRVFRYRRGDSAGRARAQTFRSRPGSSEVSARLDRSALAGLLLGEQTSPSIHSEKGRSRRGALHARPFDHEAGDSFEEWLRRSLVARGSNSAGRVTVRFDRSWPRGWESQGPSDDGPALLVSRPLHIVRLPRVV